MFRLRHHLPERRRHGREQGQVLVVFALAMVAMLAMAGLLIDSGLAWGNRRQAQTAADTAALAAMKAMADDSLPDETVARHDAGVFAADVMATANGFTATTGGLPAMVSCGGPSVQAVVVNNPPASGPHTLANDPLHYKEYVEVITTRPMRTTFSGIVGQSCWLVSARAVARIFPEPPPLGLHYPAIMATGGPVIDCNQKAFDNTGNNFTVIGDVISNSGINDSHAATDVYNGTVTYVPNPPSNCSITHSVGTPGSPATYPVTYTFDTTARTIKNDMSGLVAPCDFWWTGSTTLGDGAWWVGGTRASKQLEPGVYCATGDIGLSTNGTQGNVTFVGGGKVASSAGNLNLTAYFDNLMFFSTGGGATTTVVSFTGSGSIWQGIMYAPYGRVHITGPDASTPVFGALWGKTVQTTSGGSFTLNSSNLNGPPGPTDYTFGTLVE